MMTASPFGILTFFCPSIAYSRTKWKALMIVVKAETFLLDLKLV
jgi:hypothetical protein